ncbi:hypothetical protein B9G98_01359 [Wickerhamiella sorbophila]|uniref:NADP-dependent oxidoreductase domain-containing protein n=1 Tax=Wickerhamiella sorbophila TaxID=45607 RepID=A0A2T0FFL0_9ASCO|nr:hypothetical protein B9G98_01359 [Wickerhamiella sorbophila]PRT53739.1 hypothetical protein B9G98_01359 [Wickerhamiella sorbophila]
MMSTRVTVAPTRKLPSGSEIPVIGFGVYLIPISETVQAVKGALEVGYRLIDSASCYANEQQCGEGIMKFLAENPEYKRSDIFYTSKVWESDYGYEGAKKAVDVSLAEVKDLEYIDLYLIHSTAGGKKTRLDTYKALQEAVEAGKIRNIGVSNWGVKHLQELLDWPELKVMPVVNQIEYSPWLQHGDIVSFCNKHNIIIEAFSPLTVGQRLADPSVVSLAEKYKKSPAQILLRWSVQTGAIPLPKTVRAQRMKENIDIFDFELSKDDLKNLGDPSSYYVTVPEWDPTKRE